MPHISIKAEKLLEIFGLPITNSLLLSYIVLGLFTLFAWYFYKNQEKNTKIIFIARLIVKGLYTFFEGLMKEKITIFFPLLASFFLFIALSNWAGLLPGVGSIVASIKGEEHHVPLLRAGTADLNTTIALALIAVFFVQYYGFKFLGRNYITKFINLKSPIGFGLGLLEIVSEFSRILSFSFRLFGNVFAGEVLLTIVAFLVPVLASFPFLMLELFVGVIQALVFSMLAAVFFSTAIAHSEH
jgi:F-type H+-transporting ATPase subunit a